MMELKPCPFCGGSAWTEEYPVKDGLSTFSVYCERCGAETSLSYKSREEAAEAWNTRAERTCRVESERIIDYGYTVQQPEWTFDLSCGHSVTWDDCPDYCPVCGAKVVDE